MTNLDRIFDPDRLRARWTGEPEPPPPPPPGTRREPLDPRLAAFREFEAAVTARFPEKMPVLAPLLAPIGRRLEALAPGDAIPPDDVLAALDRVEDILDGFLCDPNSSRNRG